MTKTRKPQKGDTREVVSNAGWNFDVDDYRYESERGEWVVVTYQYTVNLRGVLAWCHIGMRPATADEIEAHLGPIRWWQWRRKLRLRAKSKQLPVAKLVLP